MARQPHHTRQRALTNNPIATAYFRAVEEEAHTPRVHDADIPASIGAVIELLTEAAHLRQGSDRQGVPGRPPALLAAADEDPHAARLPILRRLMEFVQDHDETAFLRHSRELAFLANTLVAGSTVQSRPFTPHEASDAVACVCNLGLECWFEKSLPSDAFLVDHDLVTVFEVGWSVLYQDVSLFVADQLMSTLADLRCADGETRHGLDALQVALAKQRAAGSPWLACDASDVLAMFDMTAWISILGLLGECPILSAALTAILERRTTAVSPTAFEFISTTAQIHDIRRFMRELSERLQAGAN
jgi:hypothetical protein